MAKEIPILKYLLFISILIFAFSCKDSKDYYSGEKVSETGSMTVRVVWNTCGQVPGINKSKSNPPSFEAPAGVVIVQAVITGDGMDTITTNHAAALPGGRTDNIPVGSNRVLTLRGLNVSSAVTWQGASIPVVITAGAVTDGGLITMNPVVSGIWDTHNWNEFTWQ